MSISAPTLLFREKTSDSITVEHTPPSQFAAPSTSWVRTQVNAVGSKGDSVSVEVTTPGQTNVTLSGLQGEQTYTVTATAVSDAAEISAPSEAIRAYVTISPYTDTFGEFFPRMIPDVNEAPVLSHEAVAMFLDALGFVFSDGEKSVAGENVFIDTLPREFFDQDPNALADQQEILVVLRNEPVASFSNESYNHKVDAVVSLFVYGGNRDDAGVDAARLYRFFQQRVNVQFVACGFTAHRVAPTGEPVFVGVENSGLNVYHMKLALRGVRTDLDPT